MSCLIGVALIGASLLTNQPAEASQGGETTGELFVYVGTYTNGESKGIYLLRMDPRTGQLSEPTLAAEAKSPSFLAVHPTKRVLYAVNEISGNDGDRPGGAVSAFAIGPDGSLTLLNEQSSRGAGPCFVAVDEAGAHVLVANYGGGSVAVLPIDEDGRLESASATVQHEGSSVDPKRQQGPHAHSINPDPSNQFALAADLGLDRILVYRLDATAGTITPHDPPDARVEPGAGPRHLAFHPNGRFAYVMNELQSTVTSFAWDAAEGTLEALQTLPTLPADFSGTNHTADVQVHPSGRFVYGSNRGHDTIAVFGVDEANGRLSPVEHRASGGKTPRHFGIDPSGTYLLAANQDSNSLVVFRIDQQSGRLAPTGTQVEVPSPVCVRFVRR
ncbi:MAG: beta-propeller fold lactonase family protein [Luteitalea sp.]|nr:beta-propeller fold lactonase family protein [Luteitalea sp.]